MPFKRANFRFWTQRRHQPSHRPELTVAILAKSYRVSLSRLPGRHTKKQSIAKVSGGAAGSAPIIYEREKRLALPNRLGGQADRHPAQHNVSVSSSSLCRKKHTEIPPGASIEIRRG